MPSKTARMRGDIYASVVVWLLYGAAVGVPIIVAPVLLGSAVDLPKKILLTLIIALGWSAVLARWHREGFPGTGMRGAGASLLAWLALAAASSLGAENMFLSLENAGLLAAYAALMYLVCLGTPDGSFGGIAASLLLGGGIVAAYGVIQFCGLDFMPWESSWGSRCFGTIGNPVFFAEYLAPLFVLGTAVWLAEKEEEKKDLTVILLAIMFVALLFSQTRSAWVGVVVGLAVAVFYVLRAVPRGGGVLIRNRKWLLAFAVFAPAVVFTVSSPALFGKAAIPLKDRVADMFNMKGWTVRHRMVLWRASMLMARDAPLLGVGLDGFRTQFPLKQAAFRKEMAVEGLYFPPKEQKAHSDYFQMLAEHGVLGLGAWFWFLCVVFKAAWTAARRARDPGEGFAAAGVAGGCASLLADACFNFPFHIIPAAMVFFFLAGFAVKVRGGVQAGRFPGRGRRGLKKAAALSAAAILLAAVVWEGVRGIAADRTLAEGNYYLDAGMNEMAQSHFEKSIKFRGYDPLAHYWLGTAYMNAGNFDWSGRSWDRALVEFRAARRLGLNDEQLYGKMAMLFEKKGNLERAIEYAGIAEHIMPDYADNLANKAYFMALRERDIPRALEISGRALDLTPNHPLYAWIHALVLEKAGRFEEALEFMAKAEARLWMIQHPEYHRPDLKKDEERIRKAARGE